MEWHGHSQFALNCRIARFVLAFLSLVTVSFPRHAGRPFTVDTTISHDYQTLNLDTYVQVRLRSNYVTPQCLHMKRCEDSGGG